MLGSPIILASLAFAIAMLVGIVSGVSTPTALTRAVVVGALVRLIAPQVLGIACTAVLGAAKQHETEVGTDHATIAKNGGLR